MFFRNNNNESLNFKLKTFNIKNDDFNNIFNILSKIIFIKKKIFNTKFQQNKRKIISQKFHQKTNINK